MKRLFYILTIVVFVLLLTAGCGKDNKNESNNKSYLNEPVVKTMCSLVKDYSVPEEDFIFKYENMLSIYSKGGLIFTEEYKEILTMSDTDRLVSHSEDAEEELKKYKEDFDGVSYLVHIEGNQVIADYTRDFSQCDTSKVKEYYYLFDSDIVDKYPKLDTMIKLYTEVDGYTCS